MAKAIASTGTAIAYAAEAVVDFFMISKFGAAVGVVATMAFLGFGLPAFFSLFA
jgi:hypothetical protein